jgi:Holliday junction resolvasome RuvABC endonuclease subunit
VAELVVGVAMISCSSETDTAVVATVVMKESDVESVELLDKILDAVSDVLSEETEGSAGESWELPDEELAARQR